jgi:hypothetical protein
VTPECFIDCSVNRGTIGVGERCQQVLSVGYKLCSSSFNGSTQFGGNTSKINITINEATCQFINIDVVVVGVVRRVGVHD